MTNEIVDVIEEQKNHNDKRKSKKLITLNMFKNVNELAGRDNEKQFVKKKMEKHKTRKLLERNRLSTKY